MAALEVDFAKFYAAKGTPSKPVRLMAGLLILKQMFNKSDEVIVEERKQNPYYQYFTGGNYFEWELPCDASDLVHFRKRIGKEESNKIENAPSVINSMEVFDQTAASLLYINPVYSIFGVGLNTINITSTKYMSEFTRNNFDTINIAPINGIIYIMSRIGLVGLLYFIFSVYKVIKSKNNNENDLKEILVIHFIYYLHYRNIFLAIYGIIFQKNNKRYNYSKLKSKLLNNQMFLYCL